MAKKAAKRKTVTKKTVKKRAVKKKTVKAPAAPRKRPKKKAAKKRAAKKKTPPKRRSSTTVSTSATASNSRKRSGNSDTTKKQPAKKQSAEDAQRTRANNRQREVNSDKREIGAIPAPKNPKRRTKCTEDFGKFLKTYFPADTRHPWSDCHIKVIKAIEIVVLVGAMLAIGIPRGWGKTFLSVRGIIWACAYRHHTMLMLIAASDDAAKDLLQDIRDELETNKLLQQDFPELCFPMAALEGINQRAKGQTSGGKPTKVKAEPFELHLGDINGQHGCVIFAGGITGSRIRGKRKKRGDRIQRPTCGLIDDFQTRASARSKTQVDNRVNIVQDDVPGLPGNDESWSCLLTCTVIVPNDGADQLLDRTQHPDWRGIRQSFLESIPNEDAIEHWEEWNRLREEDLQHFDDDIANIDEEAVSARAHEYYRKNFKKMNAGAVIAWKYAYKPEHYIDALEKAMHWYFRSRRGFWSELQNEPGKFEVSALPSLLAINLVRRWHACPRHIVPAAAEYLTVHADLSHAILWYEIRAWAQDSTSWAVDYGSWPNQNRAYFAQATAKNTIDKHYESLPTWEVRCMAAIRDLFVPLFDREFQRQDKATMRLNLAGIDANDEKSTVLKAIHKAGLAGKLWPMHSRSFRPPKAGLNDTKKRDGDVVGDNWRRRKPETGSLRYITYDTDIWKSHHRNRLIMNKDSPGSISWFKGVEHRMQADHHSEETSRTMTVDGRSLEIWDERNHAQNHLWDVGVGNDVLGSVIGCRIPANQLLKAPPRRKRKRRKTTVAT